MKRALHKWGAGILGAGLLGWAIVASMGRAVAGPEKEPMETATAPRAEGQIDAPARGTERLSDGASAGVSGVPSKGPVDPERVKRALEDFKAVARATSKEALENEQKRLTAFLDKAHAVSVEPPQVERVRDAKGVEWSKLTYASGEVRYELPMD